ncbi:DinB family protein [Deinococcus roseus]|uniref:Damage-inducible protein DinB n=1 Tax=Deinococcus roseus TaxID=392414 RepID=A0ABQ2CUP3_9DEIO|nr:DinB family protein [Deinococcus roseus]GGJ22322.1 hypothetical protein GCM10008938_05730 [Deinococcus roseus]
MTIATNKAADLRNKPLNQLLFPDLDQEFAVTRKLLERVPMEQADFKPHPKSFTLQALANHVAGFPDWGLQTIQQDVLDFAEEGEPSKPLTTREALLEHFDRKAQEFKAALSQLSDEALQTIWTMKSGDQIYVQGPRGEILRNGILSHLVHHRAQLGVYLRLLDVPVPSSYGPTADEF